MRVLCLSLIALALSPNEASFLGKRSRDGGAELVDLAGILETDSAARQKIRMNLSLKPEASYEEIINLVGKYVPQWAVRNTIDYYKSMTVISSETFHALTGMDDDIEIELATPWLKSNGVFAHIPKAEAEKVLQGWIVLCIQQMQFTQLFSAVGFPCTRRGDLWVLSSDSQKLLFDSVI